jgi:hypothetical protein
MSKARSGARPRAAAVNAVNEKRPQQRRRRPMRMSASAFRKLTGVLFILAPLWLFVNTRVLGYVSGFPDIQFGTVDELLTRVHQSGTAGVIVWYLYIVGGVLYIAAYTAFHKVLDPERIRWLGIATALGIVAWAVQFFGLTRWIFVFPYLANEWVATSNPQTRETLTIVFHAFNNYAGFALGQTIGIHLTWMWILLVGIAIKKSPLFKPWMGYAAIVIAIGEFIGNLGPLGKVVPGIDIKTFFNISGFFWNLSFLWMAYLGIVMIRSRADVYDDLVPDDLL